MTVNLDFLPVIVMSFLLMFARIGTMMMLIPAFGETFIPVRVRLTIALLLTYVMLPINSGLYPADAMSSLARLLSLLGGELLVGIFIGLSMKLISYALSTAGTIMANQSGLAFAMGGDATNSGQQGALMGNFLNVLGICMVFVTNLHYVMIAAMQDSFTLFPPGNPLPVGDLSALAVDTVSHMFSVAVRLGSPFIVVGIVFYFSLGLLNKLMPQMQIFFIAMPINIMIGFGIFLLLLSTLMGYYLSEFRNALQPFLLN
ncbi:flagellar biosynthesis protein FliR [Pseudovibrio axinellae]|uniref:Flagellar biosynthetic protein FliR n=1 Tax=Pseudovibrio axinellae TaxID=989403 RepID=A0A166AN73_9HYPH|nr:flagellar biosynthetic protein FliR [Pseudovibrio axinellae]KZL21336.1 flagellar biosynthesis protein FliR [Pseudovibrio axinellae]SEQ96594.1 flagellar biosynthetic protein FliR [Pseudovibrio axinellae]